MIYRFLIAVIAFIPVEDLCASEQNKIFHSIPTLFELCVQNVCKANDDMLHQFESVGLDLAASDKRLCNKLLRHLLRRDGLSCDISTVQMLIQEGAELYPVLTLQALVCKAANEDYQCPIACINPGFIMTEQHRNAMDMLLKNGLQFNTSPGQKLVSRAIKNQNNDFVRYAIAHGLSIPEYLWFTLSKKDAYAFNYMSKQLCFKQCQSDCNKLHQSDDLSYKQIAKIACPIVNSAFFQVYAFRHAPDQKSLLKIAKHASRVTHKLFALGVTKEGFIAVYKPDALKHNWIVKTGSDHEVPVKMYCCKVGDEMSYTFLWHKHILTLPNPSSGIAASLLFKKVDVDALHPKERERLFKCGPVQFKALTSENMSLEIFYYAC